MKQTSRCSPMMHLRILLRAFFLSAVILLLPTARVQAAPCRPPVLQSVKNTASGLKITWRAPDSSASYRIYRKTASTRWKAIGETANLSFTDRKAEIDREYIYTVRCLNRRRRLVSSYDRNGIRGVRLTVPVPTSLVNETNRTMTFRWKQSTSVGSYQISYSRHSDFSDALKATVRRSTAQKIQIGGLTMKKTYYIRIRSFVHTVNGNCYSLWSAPLKVRILKTQATSLYSLSEAEVIEAVGPLFTANQRESGILACISLAQFILESGYGHTELAQNANNCFGMKSILSGNTWAGSTWDQKSIYTKTTMEEDENGNHYEIVADFRKYPCIEDSIADHSAYLLGAEKDNNCLRYPGIDTERDYRRAAQLIKNGGYATDSKYVAKLCDIIERWNLTRFNANN